MTEPKEPQSTDLDGISNKSSKDSPDFVQTKYSISLHPDWLDEDGNFSARIGEKFSDLKKEFNIAGNYPLEVELIEAFIRYTQDRDSINEKAKRKFVKSFSTRLKLTEKLIKELRSLSGAEEMYLSNNLASIDSSFSVQQSQLRNLRRALKISTSDLSAKSKVGRGLDIATLNLAVKLQDIFVRSTGLDPKIYYSSYEKVNKESLRGSLNRFAKVICEIFKTKTETSLYTKLREANKFKRQNSPKE